MTTIAWAADVLRAALVPHGYRVVVLDGFETRSCGQLIAEAVVWHHDGSPPGASPGVPNYIAGQVDDEEPGANMWVGLDGTWYLIAAGLTYHAGKVLPGKPGNSRSIGVETDHTTGETWSGVQLLDSLRIGTAALLAHMGVGPAGGLEFHATVCSPPGRKTDPDGLHLPTEQAAVATLMHPPVHPPEDLTIMDDATKQYLDDRFDEVKNALAGYGTDGGKRADGATGNPPKRLSLIGQIAEKLGIKR